MKKVLSMIIVITVLLMSCSGFAEGEHTEPILFRGVEWGAPYSEVLVALPDGVTTNNLRDSEYWYPVSEMMYDGGGWGNQYKAEIGCYTYARSSSLKNVKVAGYNVEDIYLYFLYKTDENGKLKKDAAHTAFFYGYYMIEPKDSDAVYNDLVSKLTSLYGDVDEERSDSGIINREMSLWYGAEGTMVSVMREDYSSGTHNIYIKYGYLGGDDLMDAAYEATVREESEAAFSDLDGL